jgi:hypothetical protein
MTDYSFLKSKTFWSAFFLVAYNFFSTIVPVFPDVTWLTSIVDFLGLLLITVFHVNGVNKAALASAALHTPVSGQ